MKISVITPSFNQGHLIEKTIKSVVQQEHSDLEYIVMDGKSSDNTLEVLKKYEKQLTWVSEIDDGQSDAINKGIRKASGDIVCYLNSDDTFEPGALKEVARFFENNPEVMWAYGKCKIINLDDVEIRKPITIYKNLLLRRYSYKKLLAENFISQPSTFWRMQVHQELGYFDENEHYVMDYEFWCRLGSKFDAGVINSYLANFRMYSTSKSGSLKNPQFDDELRVAKIYAGDRKMIIMLHSINRLKIVYSYKIMNLIKNMISK